MLASSLMLLLASQTAGGAASRSDIVVTGQRLDRPAVHRYVSEVTQTVGGQLARLRAPVCPEVVGMPATEAGRIVARIRQVAGEARLRVAGEACRPNITLIFVDDGAAFVRAVRSEDSRALSGVGPNDLRRLLSDGLPARSWQVVEAQNEDGVPEGTRGAQPSLGPMAAPLSAVRSASIINPVARQTVLNSVVVIETSAAVGKSLTQLADYTAMVALSGARPSPGNAGRNSILGLFEAGASAPPRLTALDLEYLAAVYDMPTGRRSVHQLGAISDRVAERLAARAED